MYEGFVERCHVFTDRLDLFEDGGDLGLGAWHGSDGRAIVGVII